MIGIGEKLRGVDVERYTVDELIELRAGARLLSAEYASAKYDVPEWLTEKATLLDAEIQRQRADAIRKRLRELDAQEAALRTSEERRTDVRSERERLQAELAKA